MDNVTESELKKLFMQVFTYTVSSEINPRCWDPRPITNETIDCFIELATESLSGKTLPDLPEGWELNYLCWDGATQAKAELQKEVFVGDPELFRMLYEDGVGSNPREAMLAAIANVKAKSILPYEDDE